MLCNVLWVAEYIQTWKNYLHQHGFFQMVCAKSGAGFMEIDAVRYDLVKNRIYLVPPQCLHSIHAGQNADEAPRFMDIKFSVTDPQLLDDLLSLGHSFDTDEFAVFYSRFQSLLNESRVKSTYYPSVVNMHFTLMLIDLIREKAPSPFPVDDSTLLQKMSAEQVVKGVDIPRLMDFVHSSYGKILSLDDLTAYAQTNKTTLIEIFKSLKGITPMKYINQLRMQKAKELLTSTDISISEIAEIVGYQSIHYFSKSFKEREKCSPYEFRVHNRESRYYSF